MSFSWKISEHFYIHITLFQHYLRSSYLKTKNVLHLLSLILCLITFKKRSVLSLPFNLFTIFINNFMYNCIYLYFNITQLYLKTYLIFEKDSELIFADLLKNKQTVKELWHFIGNLIIIITLYTMVNDCSFELKESVWKISEGFKESKK